MRLIQYVRIDNNNNRLLAYGRAAHRRLAVDRNRSLTRVGAFRVSTIRGSWSTSSVDHSAIPPVEVKPSAPTHSGTHCKRFPAGRGLSRHDLMSNAGD